MIFKFKDQSDEDIYINIRNVEFIEPTGEDSMHIFHFVSGKKSSVKCTLQDIQAIEESTSETILKNIREEIIKNREYLSACNI